jgi:hypothetical protein
MRRSGPTSAGAAFLGFFPSKHGGHPGFVPGKVWPGERVAARFLSVGGTEADAITAPRWQPVPVEVAYRAAAEYLHTPARPQSVRRFEL